MIKFIFNYLTEFTFIAIIIILLIISKWILAYKNHKIKKITLEDAKNDENSYKNYVQKYYVTNIFFTIGAVFLYFIGSYSFLIYLRFYTIQHYNNKQAVFPIDTAFISIKNPADDLTTSLNFAGPLILYFILLIGVFVAFKVFIHTLLFDEVLKFHLYFHNSILYLRIKKSTRDQYLRQFFGSCYLFIWNVSNLKALSDLDDLDVYDFNSYDTIYENTTIYKLSFNCVRLSKKYYIIYCLFKTLRYIFEFLYRHFNYTGFFLYIPYIIYSIAFIYDFLHLQFYYSYYLLFPMFFIYLWCQFILFMQVRSESHENKLYIYFYDKNNIKSRRPLNADILAMQYILNNFQNVYEEKSTEVTIILKKKLKAMYQRYFLIVISGILTGLIIKQNLYSIIIIPLMLKIPVGIFISILFICAVYCSTQTFKLPKDTQGDYLENYIYSRKYNILYWIITIIQIYLYWLLLVKPTLFIIYDNVVWEHINIRIIHNYTLEEKLKMLYDYFDKIMKQINLPEDHIIILKEFIAHFDLKNVITDYTRLSELKEFLTKTLLEDYLRCHQYWEEIAIQNASKHAAIKIMMDGVTNIINLIIFWKFFTVYLSAYLLIIHHPVDPGITKLIIFWVRRMF